MEEIKEKELSEIKNFPNSKIDNNVYRSLSRTTLEDTLEYKKWLEHPITKCLFKQFQDYNSFVDNNRSYPRIMIHHSSITGKIVDINLLVRKPQTNDFIEYGLIKATDKNGNEITDKTELTKDDTEFYLTFDSPYFYEGDYIENGKELFRVMNNPLLKDNRYVYKVERISKKDYPVFAHILTPGSGFAIQRYIYETDL